MKKKLNNSRLGKTNLLLTNYSISAIVTVSNIAIQTIKLFITFRKINKYIITMIFFSRKKY